MARDLPAPLPADKLYRSCDPAALGFTSTEELDDVDGLIGQERALDAIRFGGQITQPGFNLFVLGPPGSGKHTAVRRFLERKAGEEPLPSDWVYVNNFDAAHKPRAIALPPGRGLALRRDMHRLITDLQTSIPAIFESEEYQVRRRAIEGSFRDKQEEAFRQFRERAEAENIAVLRTPAGFAMAPMRDGKVIDPQAFNELPEEERKAIQDVIQRFERELEPLLQNIPRWDKERREKIRALDREIAEVVVAQGLAELEQSFADLPDVLDYLAQVRASLIDNVALFLMPRSGEAPNPQSLTAGHKDPRFSPYHVNVLVSQGSGPQTGTGAPVKYEDHPTMSNLLGRVEHISEMGALVTDFSLIKPGALHLANGGYLLLDARRLLSEPLAWDALKRALQSRTIKIESPGQFMSLISTVSLEPDPIPLNVKVVLFGERLLYYLLCAADPDFEDLFKVAADFDEDIERTPDSQKLFAHLIATTCRREGLRHLESPAAGRLIEHASRMAGDGEKLSVRTGLISDILREADFWAARAERQIITAEDIERTLKERLRRADRLREKVHEAILRDTVLIDTEGEAVGQINGLSVFSVANTSFGSPTRITANVRMGSGKVIDIEREVDLGGPIHSKGVLILSGYLADRYAPDVPMSLSASLVFEQSYGGVEGDSASSAELYALLSAISGVALKQSFAVTGSVNQKGQVQAIGGVNEKIEGFFDICRARKLTGEQGVLIPAANVKHLMLRRDVVEACEAGRFHIYAVETIDQGMEILTGMPAGERDGNGRFPPDSINGRVEEKLIAFAKARRAFTAAGAPPEAEAKADDFTQGSS